MAKTVSKALAELSVFCRHPIHRSLPTHVMWLRECFIPDVSHPFPPRVDPERSICQAPPHFPSQQTSPNFIFTTKMPKIVKSETELKRKCEAHFERLVSRAVRQNRVSRPRATGLPASVTSASLRPAFSACAMASAETAAVAAAG